MLRHIPFVGSLFALVCGLTMHLIRALALQRGEKLIRLCWTSKYCANKSGVGTSSSEKFNLPKQGEQYITECQCHSIVMQIGMITATLKFAGRDDWLRHTLTMKKTHGAIVKPNAHKWFCQLYIISIKAYIVLVLFNRRWIYKKKKTSSTHCVEKLC